MDIKCSSDFSKQKRQRRGTKVKRVGDRKGKNSQDKPGEISCANLS